MSLSTSPIIQVAPQGFDLAAASLDCCVATIFPKSRGSGYSAAVAFAKHASMYEEVHVEKATFHAAVFGRSRDQAASALAVIRNLKSTKGLQILSGGKLLQDPHRIVSVLNCYLEASANVDHRSHCVEMVSRSHLRERFWSGGAMLPGTVLNLDFITSRSNEENELIAFPCRYLRARNFRFQPSHPSSDDDQIRAAAVREGCDWCPAFTSDIQEFA